jgi:citrate lyase subunit beta/citryl-CoA lyase
VIGLTWGAEDLVAAMGGTSSRFADGTYRDYARYARSRVLIAAASEGKPAYDTVHLDIADDAGQQAEAEDAAGSGFSGTMCIHPRQVPLVRAAFRPTPERLDWARRVLAQAATAGSGVFAFEGRMIDEPLLRQAARIVASADPADLD